MKLPLALLALGVLSQAQRSPELETGMPREVVLPPPWVIDTRVAGRSLQIRFQVLGLDRVIEYRVYIRSGRKWSLIGATKHPPAILDNCAGKPSDYRILAVDESHTEGDARQFRAKLTCLRIRPDASK